MPGRYVRCWQCGWSQLRLQHGKLVTHCGCGHSLDGSKPPAPPNHGKGNGKGSNAHSSPNVPSAKRWVSRRSNAASKPPQSSAAPTLVSSPASTMSSGSPNEMDVSDNTQSTKEYHAGIIAKYEAVVAGLDPVTDAAIIASLNDKVNASKQAIVALRPLPSQIASLEAWLDRKSAKLLEYQRLIVDSHQSFLTLKEEVATKRVELLQLKQQHATEVAGQPVQPLDLSGQLRNASLEHQLTGLNAVLRQVATALSTMENAPPALKTVLEPFIGAPVVPNAFAGATSHLPGTPLGSSAPVSPPQLGSSAPGIPGPTSPKAEDAFGESDSYGPVATAPSDARSSPFAGADTHDTNLDQLAHDAAMAHFPTPQVSPMTQEQTQQSSFSHNTALESPPG